MAYVTSGIIEELVKYRILQYTVPVGRPIRARIWLTMAAAASLGFSTTEAVSQLDTITQDINQGIDLSYMKVLGPMLIGPAIHVLGGELIGLNMIRQDILKERLSIFDIVTSATLFHAGYSIILMLANALQLFVGGADPRDKMLTVFAVGYVLVYFEVFRRKLAALKTRVPV